MRKTDKELIESLTGFTQKPWSWVNDQAHTKWEHGWRVAPGVLLADGLDGTPDGDEIDRANAALIAAAPDLYRIVTELVVENSRLQAALEALEENPND